MFDAPVRLLASPHYYETMYGESAIVKYVEIESGATMVWFGSASAVDKMSEEQTTPGWEGRIRATVKDHSEYNGTKQTVINRVMVLDN